MAYIEVDVIREATGFSDDEKISDDKIELYIANAGSVIDSYIGDVYVLPLAISGTGTVPSIIETICQHITVGLLYADEYGEESEDSDKGWQKRMDWAMKLLEKIQKQTIKLRNDSGVEFDRTSFKSPSYYPTEESSDPDAEDSTAPKLTMNQRF